jgi:Na+/melibiose symporter-like transporter
VSDLPTPSRPYRGSAMLHAVLALVILVVAMVSGGDLVKAVLVAGAYFVIATAWVWFRFRQRESRAAPPEGRPSSNGSRRP